MATIQPVSLSSMSPGPIWRTCHSGGTGGQVGRAIERSTEAPITRSVNANCSTTSFCSLLMRAFSRSPDEASAHLLLDNEERPFDRTVRGWSTPSGGEISLSSRIDAVDTNDRCVHMTIRAETTDGQVEEHVLTMRQWYRDELVPLFHRAGFASVDVRPGIDEHTVVYVATA